MVCMCVFGYAIHLNNNNDKVDHENVVSQFSKISFI